MHRIHLIATIIIVAIIPPNLYSQSSIKLENEIRINHVNNVEYYQILDINSNNIFIFPISNLNRNIVKNRIDTIFQYDLKEKNLKSKIEVKYDKIQDSIFNFGPNIFAYKINGDYLIISSIKYLLIFKKIENVFTYKYAIYTGSYLENLKILNDSIIIGSSSYPKDNKFCLLKIDFINKNIINSKGIKFQHSYLGMLSSNFWGLSSNKSFLASPSEYLIYILDNKSFKITDSIIQQDKREAVPDSVSFVYKTKDDFEKLGLLRNSYFNIINIEALNDSTLLIVKTDTALNSNTYFIDVLEMKNNRWDFVVRNQSQNLFEEDNTDKLSSLNAFYPFSSNVPNIIVRNSELYILYLFIDFDKLTGKRFTDIKKIFKDRGFMIQKEYAIYKYVIER